VADFVVAVSAGSAAGTFPRIEFFGCAAVFVGFLVMAVLFLG
jgi:hypothetical protein